VPYEKTITLVRNISERTSDVIVQEKVKELLGCLLSESCCKGWSINMHKGIEVSRDPETKQYIFKKKVIFRLNENKPLDVIESNFKSIVDRLGLLGSSTVKYNKYPWFVEGYEANIVLDKSVSLDAVKMQNAKKIADICVEKDNKYFEHLFDRDHQIDIVLSSIVAGKESKWRNRFNCILHGEPGCGKSDILSSVGQMLGEEGEAYIKLDATSMTQAGAQKLLTENEFTPPVLIIEEIEKADDKCLKWLLGLLDHRAEIRKNTARTNTVKSVKMLCLATANNMALFDKVMDGALSSRFSNRIYCPRPSRDILKKILEREVEQVNGNKNWIEPALKYCVDEKKWNDPRKIIPVCLCGKDRLIDGTYQASLEAVSQENHKKAS
jgi:hypothetical protein